MDDMAEKSRGSVISLRQGVKNSATGNDSNIPSVISREFFDSVFEQSTPMYIARPDGTVLYVNTGYSDIFGSAGARKPGKGFLPPLKADHIEIINRIADTKEPETKQVAIEDIQGTEYYLSRHFPIIDSEGQFIAVCGTFINSTRQVEAETRLRLEKRRFFGHYTRSVGLDLGNRCQWRHHICLRPRGSGRWLAPSTAKGEIPYRIG